MIEVVIYYNREKELCGYCVSGHAEFAQYGQDIVCAAVSVLTINTVNAIEQFTTTQIDCEADEEHGGYLRVIFSDIQKGIKDHDTMLLLKTMVMGLEDLSKQYKKYIRLNYEEV